MSIAPISRILPAPVRLQYLAGPPPPKGGGGGGGGPVPTPNPIAGAPSCNASTTFPGSHAGDAPITQKNTFTNVGSDPLTFDSVVLHPDVAADWSIDASSLRWMLQPGQAVSFTVTFKPPAK